MDCSPSGSPVHGLLLARIPGWVAISSSRGSSRPRGWTRVSPVAGRLLTDWVTREERQSRAGEASMPNSMEQSRSEPGTDRRYSSSPRFRRLLPTPKRKGVDYVRNAYFTSEWDEGYPDSEWASGTQVHLDPALPQDTCFSPTFGHVPSTLCTCKVIEYDWEEEVPKEAWKGRAQFRQTAFLSQKKHKPMTCYIWSSSSFSPKG